MRSCSVFLLLVTSLILLATPALAERPPVVLHVGASTSTYHQDDLSCDAREGFAIGLGSQVNLGGGFALMPEVWFLQKGFKDGTIWELVDIEERLDTVSIPILLSYWFPAERLDPRVFAGFSADFVTKSRIRKEGGEWQDVSAQDESLYWSLILGGGFRAKWFDLDVRYQHGLSQVTNFDYPQFDNVIPQDREQDPAYDRSWIFTVGYWF